MENAFEFNSETFFWFEQKKCVLLERKCVFLVIQSYCICHRYTNAKIVVVFFFFWILVVSGDHGEWRDGLRKYFRFFQVNI